jgi:hypothetical protein
MNLNVLEPIQSFITVIIRKINYYNQNIHYLNIRYITMSPQCQQCQSMIKGRSDKKFCSTSCKNKFNNAQKKATCSVTEEIDGYLHRNRTILHNLMQDSKKEIFDKLVLVRSGFQFDYMTGIYTNKENKMYRYVYDYGWMDFSDQKVLVVAKMKAARK